MRADNRGEGGVLALMALVSRQPAINPRRRRIYLMLGMAGRRPVLRRLPADARHLGAERGRRPQGRDTGARSGGVADRHRRAGGPVRRPAVRHGRRRPLVRADHARLVHRAVRARPPPDRRGAAGAVGAFCRIMPSPSLCIMASSPSFALGAVTLAVTGAEALYADMGHFGASPSAAPGCGWCCRRCSPTTTARARCCCSDPSAIENPSSAWRRTGRSFPLVALATAATVIASQATISGAFSMAQQAALLGLSPRVHDPAHLGQRVRPDLRAGGELAAAGRRGGAGAGLQVVDQPRRRLRHRRHRHDAGHHHAGVRAGVARLEMALAAGDPGVRRLPAGRRSRCSRPTC